MTAAMVHPQRFPELASRRLREESEHLQAPALLIGAALIASLLLACGWMPTPVPGPVELVPSIPGFEFLPPPSTAHDPTATPLAPIPFADPHTQVRPVERIDEQPLVPETHEQRADGPSIPGSPGQSGSIGTPQQGVGMPTSALEPGVFIYTDELPRVVSRVTPEYPAFAHDAGVEGTVVVWALVGLDGRVDEVRIQKSVPMLDAAAADAVRGWRFTPALANEHPVRVWVAVPVRFRLHD